MKKFPQHDLPANLSGASDAWDGDASQILLEDYFDQTPVDPSSASFSQGVDDVQLAADGEALPRKLLLCLNSLVEVVEQFRPVKLAASLLLVMATPSPELASFAGTLDDMDGSGDAVVAAAVVPRPLTQQKPETVTDDVQLPPRSRATLLVRLAVAEARTAQLSETTDAVTLSASASAPAGATWSQQVDDIGLSASADAVLSGAASASLSQALDAVTLSAGAVAPAGASVSVAIDPVTLAAAGAPGVSGSQTQAVADVSVAATGGPGVSASATASIADVELEATQSGVAQAVTGSLSQAVDEVTGGAVASVAAVPPAMLQWLRPARIIVLEELAETSPARTIVVGDPPPPPPPGVAPIGNFNGALDDVGGLQIAWVETPHQPVVWLRSPRLIVEEEVAIVGRAFKKAGAAPPAAGNATHLGTLDDVGLGAEAGAAEAIEFSLGPETRIEAFQPALAWRKPSRPPYLVLLTPAPTGIAVSLDVVTEDVGLYAEAIFNESFAITATLSVAMDAVSVAADGSAGAPSDLYLVNETRIDAFQRAAPWWKQRKYPPLSTVLGPSEGSAFGTVNDSLDAVGLAATADLSALPPRSADLSAPVEDVGLLAFETELPSSGAGLSAAIDSVGLAATAEIPALPGVIGDLSAALDDVEVAADDKTGSSEHPGSGKILKGGGDDDALIEKVLDYWDQREADRRKPKQPPREEKAEAPEPPAEMPVAMPARLGVGPAQTNPIEDLQAALRAAEAAMAELRRASEAATAAVPSADPNLNYLIELIDRLDDESEGDDSPA